MLQCQEVGVPGEYLKVREGGHCVDMPGLTCWELQGGVHDTARMILSQVMRERGCRGHSKVTSRTDLACKEGLLLEQLLGVSISRDVARPVMGQKDVYRLLDLHTRASLALGREPQASLMLYIILVSLGEAANKV